jgi:putative DNA methylase
MLLRYKKWGGQSWPQPPFRRSERFPENFSCVGTPSCQKRHYERRLPHWDTVDQPLFVRFRLHGSLPAHRVFPPDSLAQSGRAFVTMDRLLDRGSSGPLYLQRSELAQMVVAALHDGELRFHRYQLHAYVVMPNHVHILVTPIVLATRCWLP